MRTVPLFALLVAACGCEVTSEQIAAWRDTQKGPGKLREALRDPGLKPELRGHALAVLAELGMLSEIDADLAPQSPGDRAAVALQAAPRLIQLAGKSEGASLSKVEKSAKDALFQIRDLVPAAERGPVDDALIAWTTVDLAGRMTAGGQSSEKILSAIGAKAGPRLAAVLVDGASSEASRLTAAQLCNRVCDREARAQAGAKLVERAKRERVIQEATLQQLGLVGGDHAVAYLTQLGGDVRQTAQLRQKALFALAQSPDPAALAPVIALARDAKVPGEVRDAAFEVAEKIGAPAVPELIKLFPDKDEKVRWRAVEAALGAGKERAVVAVLETLPDGFAYPKEDLTSFVVHDLRLIGPPALPPLRQALASKRPLARLVAVLALGEIGKAGEAAAVEALAGDGAKIKGWPAGATVGSEAKSVAARLVGKP